MLKVCSIWCNTSWFQEGNIILWRWCCSNYVCRIICPSSSR